jgi:hypothetical protein
MGDSTQQTSTSSTAPSNPDVNNTISALAKGISSEYSPGKSLYTAPGATTTGGQAAALTAANNPFYSSSVNGAIQSFGNTAAGNDFGMNDPGYAALRQNTINDTLAATNKSYNSAGLFGSDSNQKAAGQGVANAVSGLDYANYQSDIARQQAAAGILPGLFSAGQLPASVQQGIGAQQDANTAAQANGPTDFLAKLTGISTGNASASGTTTTNTQPGTPLWQSFLGYALGNAGNAARAYGG